MKFKNIKIIIAMMIITCMTCFINTSKVSGANVSLDVPSSVTQGETITAKISGKAEQWNLILKANGTKIGASNNLTNEGSEITISGSGTYTTTSTGTVTVTLTGDYSYTDGDSVKTEDVNITKTVTVKERQTTPTPEPEPTPTPTPTPEPNFTSTNRTMYATGDINLRESWSTSTKATKIQKGTEVTVTATSSNTVNGFVWYRVSYNGQTKYVAGYLLTANKPEEEKKSNNADLKSLVVEGQELSPKFSSDVNSYSISVKSDVQKIDIKAEAQDEKATIDIKGNKDLKLGANTVTISVTAEDGTIKIYEIKVTKADEETTLGLKSLKIEGTDIEKTFKTDKYEYNIEITDVEKLEIEAIANDEKATVEILGNEELQEGKNIITIIVKSEDGEQTVTYQIEANKVIKKDIPVTTSNNSNNMQIYIYIGIIVVAVIALVAVLIYFIKNRNNEKAYYVPGDYEDDEEFEGFPEELPEKIITKDNDDDDDENGEDTFKRKGKHF